MNVTPHPDVIVTELRNGEVVLLHMGNQTYYTLNATGAEIWQQLAGGKSVEDACQYIVARYDVADSQASHSVSRLVQELEAEGLVTRAPIETDGEDR